MAGKNTAFRNKFEKFKKKSDELYGSFMEMRTKLKALTKEATKLSNEVYTAVNECDFNLFTLLADYATFVGETSDDIYGMLFNMKNSTFKKAIPMDKRKKSIFAQHTS